MTEASLWGLQVLCCALLGVSSSAAGETLHHYVVHHDAVTFDDALSQCSHSSREGGGGGGVLTTLATQREVQDVLAAVSPSLPDGPGGPPGHNFWLGLRKAKTDCVVPHLPLKGFKWTADGSETTQVHGGYRWRKEPPETCTALRCLMLSMESREDWALTDSSCKARHPFICKYVQVAVDGAEAAAPAETDGRQETRDVDVETSDPVARLPATPPHPDDARPTTTPAPAATSSPPEQPTQPPRAPPTQPPPPPPPPPPSSSSQPQPHPGLEIKGDCRDAPIVNGSRSLRQHPDQPGRMTVECWSGEEVELNCSEATTGGRWEVASGALLDRLDDACTRCDDGFEMDGASWTCRDVDECQQSAPCGGGGGGGGGPRGVACVNTPGSYRCVCYDARGAAHDEGSAACVAAAVTPGGGGGGGGGAEVETADHGAQSGILVPALIAAAVLLLLLAVGGVVAVRCCLARRAKKRAAEKEDDKMAMDAAAGRHKDAMETTNEKEAI